MKRAMKIWLVIGIVLILIGCAVFGGVMMTLDWDFSKLSTDHFETNEHTVGEDFHSISVETKTAAVLLVPSEDGACRVVCHEKTKVRHSVAVTDGVLTVQAVDTRKWYEHISLFEFASPQITVYLPLEAYTSLTVKGSTGAVELPANFEFERIDVSVSTGKITCRASASVGAKLSTSTGEIDVQNASFGALELSVSTGDVTVSGVACTGDVSIGVSTGKANLTDVTCKNLVSKGDTGDISLKNVIALERFSIERDTGDVKFDGCDAAELFVKTDTGDVVGSLLTEKVFITKTDTGRIKVPSSVTGGRCEITTDTGNIQISVLS